MESKKEDEEEEKNQEEATLEASFFSNHNIFQLFKKYIPKKTQDIIFSINVNEAVTVTQEGNWMTSWEYNRFLGVRRSRIFVWIDTTTLSLYWSRERFSLIKTEHIDLNKVDSISSALALKAFLKNAKAAEKNLGILICVKASYSIFVCQSLSTWSMWMKGLYYMHSKSSIQDASIPLTPLEYTIMRLLWEKAGSPNSNIIHFNLSVVLLKSLNFSGDIFYIRKIFYRYVKDASYLLTFPEFFHVFTTLLTCKTLKEDFLQYCQNGKTEPLLDLHNFATFLHSVQHASRDEIQQVLNHLKTYSFPFLTSSCAALQKKFHNRLTFFGFCRYITSENNNIFDLNKMKQYQPMTYPLTSYWIRTLYMWYFDQRTKSQALLQLANALKQGYRGVVIPVTVYAKQVITLHAAFFSQTSETLYFSEVLETVSENAFRDGNRFPVILILAFGPEDDEAPIVFLLRKYLKDKLRAFSGFSTCSMKTKNQSEFTPESQLESFFALKLVLSEAFKDYYSVKEYWNKLPIEQWENLLRSSTAFDPLWRSSGGLIPDSSKVQRDSSKYPEFPGLQVCHRFHRTLFSDGAKNPFFLYLTDEDFETLKKDQKLLERFKRYHSENLCLSLLLAQGNLNLCLTADPCVALDVGIQLVAYPYDTSSFCHLMMQSHFLENGNCGYLLKSQVFREMKSNKHLKDKFSNFTITVLEARQLPHVFYEDSTLTDMHDNLSHLVVVSVYGVLEDRASYETPLEFSNGFNPSWTSSSFTFSVTSPSVAVLTFEVLYFTIIQRVTVAVASIPVTCLKSGLRWVPLRDLKLNLLPTSGIIVRVTFNNSKLSA